MHEDSYMFRHQCITFRHIYVQKETSNITPIIYLKYRVENIKNSKNLVNIKIRMLLTVSYYNSENIQAIFHYLFTFYSLHGYKYLTL
jgi:hypothetical protein